MNLATSSAMNTVARRSEEASALLVTLVTTAIIGISMASYLGLVSSQNRSTMHSLQWNSAIPVIEAGIEEALTHLYHHPNDRGADGWNLVNGYFTKERTIGDSKVVTMISSTTPPEIISLGYVPKMPGSAEYMGTPRAVRVTTTTQGLFVRGMVAKGTIDMSGNNVATDSFDSADPAYSTDGRYDPAKAKDGGSVGTNLGVINSLSVGNADIYGPAATGPGGSPSIGPNGGIGPKWWRSAGNNGIKEGWFEDDMNVSFPDVEAPFSGGALTPSSGKVGKTTYTYVLGSGNYKLSSLSMSGKNSMLVTGDAVLYVTGNVSMSGQSQILIEPNASLKLYVAGSNADLSGKGVVNYSGNSTNFFYYGLPSNKSLKLSGNAEFTGVIYAPDAAFTLGGGGSGDYDFVGASVTGSVTMNGHFKFHYDENLSRIDGGRGFLVDSWNEINWNEESYALQ